MMPEQLISLTLQVYPFFENNIYWTLECAGHCSRCWGYRNEYNRKISAPMEFHSCGGGGGGGSEGWGKDEELNKWTYSVTAISRKINQGKGNRDLKVRGWYFTWDGKERSIQEGDIWA